MDAFDTLYHRPAQMTEDEARAIVAEMVADTSRAARVKLWKTALKIGNLSDAAKDVYRAALANEGGAA
jgi:hypothetical protein